MIDTRDTINTLLKEHNVGEHFQIGFNAKMNVMINQLNMLVGGGNTASMQHTESVVLKPVTEFMGVPIERAKRVTATQLNPRNEEVKVFRAKVDKLEQDFPNLTNEQVLDAYGKVDTNVLRALARRAGVPDYQTVEINDTLIDQIRDGFSQIAKVTGHKAEVEDQINQEIKNNEISLEDLKVKAQEVVASGHTEELKSALAAAGADKVSNLKQEQWADFYKEMEAILNPDEDNDDLTA